MTCSAATYKLSDIGKFLSFLSLNFFSLNKNSNSQHMGYLKRIKSEHTRSNKSLAQNRYELKVLPLPQNTLLLPISLMLSNYIQITSQVRYFIKSRKYLQILFNLCLRSACYKKEVKALAPGNRIKPALPLPSYQLLHLLQTLAFWTFTEKALIHIITMTSSEELNMKGDVHKMYF